MAIDGARQVDSDYWTVGDSDDGKWYHDGADTYFTNDTGVLYIKNTSHGDNIVMSCETAGGAAVTIGTFDPDQGNGALTFADNISTYWGTNYDTFARHDDTNFYLTNQKGSLIIKHNAIIGDGDILIDNNCHGYNVIITAEDAGGTDRTLLTADPDTESANVLILRLTERAASAADVAGQGQLWVKNTTPCELWFTSDTGVDTQLA